MKLLFDQNLAPRLAVALADIYPGSAHVRDFQLDRGTADLQIWQYAKAHGYVIVSKDEDFLSLSLLHGHPPKVVRLCIGNCPTKTVEALLRRYSVSLHTFNLNPIQAHLIIP